jgi:dUTP pyrophosphatase
MTKRPHDVDGITPSSSLFVSHLFVKLNSDNAKLPTRGSAKAAGYDIYSAEQITIPANGKTVCVKTDISIEIHAERDGYYGKLEERSSMAKNNVRLGGGVVDEDFRGPIEVMLYNTGDTDYIVEKHHRIAQLIIQPYLRPEIMQLDKLTETERGTKGFGSTGL